MKNLIISIVCLLILIVPWGFYDKYAAQTVKSYDDILTNDVIPAIESGDWVRAEFELALIKNDWESFKQVSVYFIDTPTLNEVDYTISETVSSIIQQDDVNAFTGASSLKCRFEHLYSNQALSSENVF